MKCNLYRIISKVFSVAVFMSANIGAAVAQQPTISYIAPVSGTINGGTAMNIHGTNFVAGATVTIGGAKFNVTSLGSTLIKGTTSGHVAGGADVVVTNPSKQSATYSATLNNQGFESGNTQWQFVGGGAATIVNCSSNGCTGNVNNAHSGTYYAELSSPGSAKQPSFFVAGTNGQALYFPVSPAL